MPLVAARNRIFISRRPSDMSASKAIRVVSRLEPAKSRALVRELCLAMSEPKIHCRHLKVVAADTSQYVCRRHESHVLDPGAIRQFTQQSNGVATSMKVPPM